MCGHVGPSTFRMLTVRHAGAWCSPVQGVGPASYPVRTRHAQVTVAGQQKVYWQRQFFFGVADSHAGHVLAVTQGCSVEPLITIQDGVKCDHLLLGWTEGNVGHPDEVGSLGVEHDPSGKEAISELDSTEL